MMMVLVRTAATSKTLPFARISAFEY